MLVEKNQVEKAVKALFEFLKNNKDDDNNLLKGDEVFHLLFNLSGIPNKTVNPAFFSVPNSVYNDSTSICIITKDIKEEQKELLEKEKVKGVAQIIPFKQLKDSYKTHESKRTLCQSYDLFLADDRLIPLLPNYLGKTFFLKKKLPVPIAIKNGTKSIKSKVESCFNKCPIYFPSGTLLSVKIANENHSAEQVVENVMAGLEHIPKEITKKLKGNGEIASILLKVAHSPGLPLYATIPKHESTENNKKRSLSEEVEEKVEEEKSGTNEEVKKVNKEQVKKISKKQPKKAAVKGQPKEEITKEQPKKVETKKVNTSTPQKNINKKKEPEHSANTKKAKKQKA